jgi:hypothetical protein
MNWSKTEVELITASYFDMLSKELPGKSYSKAAQRRELLPLLNNRSEGSVEFKYQNISAVLINLGQPYIKGYLPRYNYQKMLEDQVIEHLQENLTIEDLFKSFAEREVVPPLEPVRFTGLLVEPPEASKVSEQSIDYRKRPIKVNYLEREQQNTKLGLLGEQFILEYEKWDLIQRGREKFAEQVRWISREEGDGAGFDILSKNETGKDKYIEVKTTKLGKETPIYFTRNELLFSTSHPGDYHLFRLFDFERDVRLFIKNGGLDRICRAVPMMFKGLF